MISTKDIAKAVINAHSRNCRLYELILDIYQAHLPDKKEEIRVEFLKYADLCAQNLIRYSIHEHVRVYTKYERNQQTKAIEDAVQVNAKLMQLIQEIKTSLSKEDEDVASNGVNTLFSSKQIFADFPDMLKSQTDEYLSITTVCNCILEKFDIFNDSLTCEILTDLGVPCGKEKQTGPHAKHCKRENRLEDTTDFYNDAQTEPSIVLPGSSENRSSKSKGSIRGNQFKSPEHVASEINQSSSKGVKKQNNKLRKPNRGSGVSARQATSRRKSTKTKKISCETIPTTFEDFFGNEPLHFVNVPAKDRMVSKEKRSTKQVFMLIDHARFLKRFLTYKPSVTKRSKARHRLGNRP